MRPRTPTAGLLGLATLLAVFACAQQRMPDLADARRDLTGKTPQQVAACMGPPGSDIARGGVRVFSYFNSSGYSNVIATPSDSTMAQFGYAAWGGDPTGGYGSGGGSFAGANAPPPRPECTVNVIFDQGRVGAVTFTGRDGNEVAKSDTCGAYVLRCLPSR